MRQLKYHEKKLLKHSDPFQWENDRNMRVYRLENKYCVKTDREVIKYLSTGKKVRQLADKLGELPKTSEVRENTTRRLQNLLYELALSDNELMTLDQISEFSGERLLERRLPSIIQRQKMAETPELAQTYIEHGHVRVGPKVVQDCNFHVARGMEDFVTWRDDSVIKRRIEEFNGTVDDYGE